MLDFLPCDVEDLMKSACCVGSSLCLFGEMCFVLFVSISTVGKLWMAGFFWSGRSCKSCGK